MEKVNSCRDQQHSEHIFYDDHLMLFQADDTAIDLFFSPDLSFEGIGLYLDGGMHQGFS